MTDRVKLTELAQKTNLNSTGTGSSTGTQGTSNKPVEILFANDATFVAGGDNADLSSLLAGLNNGSNDASSNFFTNYESQLNGMMNSAMRQAKTQMTISTIGQVAGTLGTILGGSSATGGLFNLGGLFGSGNAGAAAGAAAGAGAGAAAGAGSAGSQSGVELSSDLASAISNYSSKGNSENWTALNNEIAKAKTDRERLTQVVSESDAAVRKFNEEKPQLEQAVKDAQAKVNEAQIAVDNNKLGVQAEIRVNAIVEKDIPAQQTIISESKSRVETAQETYNTDKADAETKIEAAQNKIDANKDMAGKTPVPQEDINGNIIGYNPTQEQVNTAKRLLAEGQRELKEAQDKLEKAKKDWAAVLKTEVGSENIEAGVPENPTAGVQGKAIARIAELEAEKEQQEQIVAQNGGKDVVDKLIEARQKAQDELETAKDNLQKAKDEKDSAVTKSSHASAQIKSLDKQIEQAEKLMSKKK